MTQWKLVPGEPDAAMRRAAVVLLNGSSVYKSVAAKALEIEEQIYAEVYSAMLAAAPPAPSAEPVQIDKPADIKTDAISYGEEAYIHTCSYYCTRPACVLAQRDEMRERGFDRLPSDKVVMQMALEALEERYVGALRDNAIDALLAALEGKK
jgi:hypothetical protein